MYFSRTFTFLLRCKETILTKSSLLCERSVKFPPKCKFLALNNKAILTYSPLKNTFFTFYKRDYATFKHLNCLDRISLTSYKKHFHDRFKEMNEKHQNHACFLFPPKD